MAARLLAGLTTPVAQSPKCAHSAGGPRLGPLSGPPRTDLIAIRPGPPPRLTPCMYRALSISTACPTVRVACTCRRLTKDSRGAMICIRQYGLYRPRHGQPPLSSRGPVALPRDFRTRTKKFHHDARRRHRHGSRHLHTPEGSLIVNGGMAK